MTYVPAAPVPLAAWLLLISMSVPRGCGNTARPMEDWMTRLSKTLAVAAVALAAEQVV